MDPFLADGAGDHLNRMDAPLSPAMNAAPPEMYSLTPASTGIVAPFSGSPPRPPPDVGRAVAFLNAGDDVELEDGGPYCSMRGEARLTAAKCVR